MADYYIHKHTFPLAVPPTTQFCVRCITATAGTAVITLLSSLPSCASWSPLAVYTSTKRFMLAMQNRWMCGWDVGCCCH